MKLSGRPGQVPVKSGGVLSRDFSSLFSPSGDIHTLAYRLENVTWMSIIRVTNRMRHYTGEGVDMLSCVLHALATEVGRWWWWVREIAMAMKRDLAQANQYSSALMHQGRGEF